MMKTLLLQIITALSVASAPEESPVADDTSAADITAPNEASTTVDTAPTIFSTDSSPTASPGIIDDSMMMHPRNAPVDSPTASDSLSNPSLPTLSGGSTVPKIFSDHDTSTIDTLSVRNGSYFSAGFGWSLGGFTLMSLWENALPDSLGSFGLTVSSFSIPYDSSADPAQTQVDTALLSFSVKEEPASYTMCFPVTLSLVRLRENDCFSISLYGSWMRKIFAATIAAVNDSLARKADFREQMNIFSGFLSFAYGRRIPREYFSIQNVERSYFNAAVELAPLISCIIRRNVNAPGSDVRFGQLREKIASPPRRYLHGRAATLRLGLNLVKRLNANSATNFGIAYCIQGYGYFYEAGNRVAFNTIDPSNGKKGRPLYWVSHRFEISIAILRLHGT